MKKIGLALISVTVLTTSFAQNLFTYGSRSVTKDEFIRAFNKNPNLTTDRKTALKEYLDLYINFKLKVQAAYDAGLDKDPTQQYEFQNFKKQVAENIINEQANVKELVKEAFQRSQKEIQLSQVFVETSAGADTLVAFKKIQAAYKALKEGRDFASVAEEFSNDEATRQSKGNLGYVTVFTLPYQIENAVYALTPNSFSAPIRTKAGYHIFKNIGERKPQGSRRVAQILIAFPPNATTDDKHEAARKADSLYSLLQQGVMFEGLVVTSSNDMSSNTTKGELPEFTTGTYNANFEQVAFSLKEPGELSKPFVTEFGYHIIKLLEAKPIPTDLNDPVVFAALQDKITKDRRLDQAKKALIFKKLSQFNYKQSPVKLKDLFLYIDSALMKPVATPLKGISDATPIFSFARQSVKAGDFVRYVKGSVTLTADQKPDYQELYNQYLTQVANEYYRNHLEDYSPEYARQLAEFKEANLLFGIMEKQVWSKANDDTTGLLQYYNQHKAKYVWSPSADAIIVTCSNAKLASEIAEKIKNNPGNWREITGNGTNSDIMTDSGRYELSQLPVIDRTNFTSGLITAPVKNENDNTFAFNYIVKVYSELGQRSFEDARGMVISEYQQVLEDRWIVQLKKKYPVKVNEAVFSSIK